MPNYQPGAHRATSRGRPAGLPPAPIGLMQPYASQPHDRLGSARAGSFDWSKDFRTRALGLGLGLALATLLAGLPQGALAQSQPSEAEIAEALKIKIRTARLAALNPVVVRAVRQQNAERLALDTIRARDDEWKATRDLTPFKRQLQTSPAGQYLKASVEKGKGFTEAFLTDNQGANVAAFPATSDYWQGDEEKWTASYNGGKGKVFLGPLEYDESAGKALVQISVPVIDRDATIGVLVVGVTADYIQARR